MFSNFVNSVLSLGLLIIPIFAQQVSVSCEDVPTGSLDTTPYSTTIRQVVHNGVTEEMLFEYYKSVTYVENCDTTAVASKSASITTITIF